MKFIGTLSLLLAFDQARFTDGKPVGAGVKGHQVKRKGQVKKFAIGNLDPETGFQNCETEITIQMFDDLPVRHFKSPDCGDDTTGRRNLKKGSDKKKKGKGKKKSKEDMVGTDGGLTLAMRREESGHIAASINDYENNILYHISGKEGEENGLIVKETPLEYVLEEKDARDVSDEDDIDIIRVLSEGSTTTKRLGGPTVKKNEQRHQDRFDASSSRNLAVDDLGGNIDIMVVWTKTAECENHYGSGTACTNVNDDTHASMMALVNLAIQETNDAFIGSGIPSQLRLVHTLRHETYVEYGAQSDNALDDITDGVQGLGDVHTLRDTVGADMVHFLVNVNDYCGIAWRPSTPKYNLAYAVTDWSCATGGYTFGHELGHNFSCNHDRGTKEVCNSDLSSYNYGYRHPQGDFRSILSYNCDSSDCDTNKNGCMRAPRFSNQYQQWNGQDIGSSIADCAQTITDYLPTVAAFTTAIPDSPTISPGPTPSPAPTPENSLDFIGDALGFQAYGECQGDCDSDTDCQFGLNCKQRNGIEDVPGCGGSDSFSTWDFCYVAPPGELVYVADGNVPDNFLKECQGDCDGDGDCEWGLLCMQRGTDFPSDAPVPGCTGNGLNGYDYCWKPPAGTLVEYGDDEDTTNFPLQECWGDCDNDNDCAGNFECFQRSGIESVPGCTGQGRSGVDYCYCPPGVTCNVGPTSSPTLSPTPNPTSPPTNAPTKNPTPQPTPIPVQPTDQPTNAPTKNPTPQPTPMPVTPTTSPTTTPTSSPTSSPTKSPTMSPTPDPTPAPVQATPNPTPQPTPNPTPQPTQAQPTCCNCSFWNICSRFCC